MTVRDCDLEYNNISTALAREEFKEFVQYTYPEYRFSWFHHVFCDELEKFASGEIKKLMIFTPPRHGKSELVSRRLPAYMFGKNPNELIISASYSSDLATRMNRDVQRIILDPLYKKVFPRTNINEKNVVSNSEVAYLRNSEIFEIVNNRGVYRCAGVGQGITGMGATKIIIDDPIKDMADALSPTIRQSVWDWYTSTLFTRLQKGGGICLTLTRWHEDDLAGRILNSEDGKDWAVVSFPAIKEDDKNPLDIRQEGEALWSDEFDLDALNKIKVAVGSRVWNSLYQQRPTALEGGIIKRSWLNYWRELPDRFDEVIQSWDLSFKGNSNSDYVVGQVWGRKASQKYLIDQVRNRMDFPSTQKAIEAMSAKYPNARSILIEDKANGPAIIDTLKNSISGIIAVSPKSSKEARLSAVSPSFEAGNVFIPDPSICAWVHDYIEELTNFPNAKHDDCADSTSQALERFLNSETSVFSKNFVPRVLKNRSMNEW